jgi:hypothetical protein
MFKRRYILLIAPVLLGAVFAFFSPIQHTSALAVSNYTNYLIDDDVFTQSNSMSAADVQNFLSSEGSGLAGFSAVEDCGSTSGPHYAYYATYYYCGHNASAAQIIAAAAQAYSINPRVILSTLQKEQSLVTTPNPTSSQLNCAMGYNSCSGDTGFFYQVDNAAWQFRADMDLGSGTSFWGYTPSSYACKNSSRLYSAGLTAGANVTFTDDNGVVYNNITLADMSTATLYCYTPYVYNNPQGILGNPQYGTTGSYYSGTYNFVKYFTQWWGSTYMPFQATYAGQSAYPTIVSGNSASAVLRYQNTGALAWYDDVSAPQNNTYPLHLATTNPINSYSPFSAFWPGRDRAAGTFAHVYNSDGTLASNQHIAQPGQIVEFDFSFSVSPNMTPGFYQQYFQPVLEGSTLWNMGGVAWFNIIVQPTTFQATYAGQSNNPAITRGNSTSSALVYTNTGNQPWYDDVSAAQYNTYPVHLASTSPINAYSPFSAFWPTRNRAAGTFAHVYNADGSLAANQHIAQPGQKAEFDFSFSVSPNMPLGGYTQYFQPVLEGSSMWNMGGVAWFNIGVQ